MSHLCYCICIGAHIAFVVLVIMSGLMSHVCYLYLYRGSCRMCVICICIGAHVACVSIVFIRGLMSHLCYLYLYRGSYRICVVCSVGGSSRIVMFVV